MAVQQSNCEKLKSSTKEHKGKKQKHVGETNDGKGGKCEKSRLGARMFFDGGSRGIKDCRTLHHLFHLSDECSEQNAFVARGTGSTAIISST